MKKEQLLEAFYELKNSCYHIWDWRFDMLGNLIFTNCPQPALYQKFFWEQEAKLTMMEHVRRENTPYVYTCGSVLSWIVAYEKDGSGIYIEGPFYTAFNDVNGYSQLMEPFHFTREEREILEVSLRSLSVLTYSTMMQMTTMLHYAICQESLKKYQVQVIQAKGMDKSMRLMGEVMVDQFQNNTPAITLEDEVMERVKNGDPSAVDILKRAATLNTGLNDKDSKSLSYFQQHIHVFLTLISRAAIDGGMSRKTSLTLCADYRRRLNRCNTMHDMSNVSYNAVEEYVDHVQESQKRSYCSPQVRLCCEYMDMHPEEKITLSYLASRIGYSKYHLSHKFNEELGCSIADYMQQSKIRRACFLLRTTGASLAEISAQLGYGSSSYFSKVFREHEHMTPRAYRKAHATI